MLARSVDSSWWRGSAICRAIVILAFVSTAPAQYFGQNAVRYETYDFKVLKTAHFDIYYYDREKEAVEMAARMAERWYERLSTVLQHELPPNQPIILYDNQPAFRATTVIPGQIGETTGGVTEALKRRVVLPFADSLADTDHVLGHELTHAFQYSITTPPAGSVFGSAPRAARLPLWFIEGMAEYLSLGPRDATTAMWVRDAVLREKIPAIEDLDDPDYFPYRWGHAFWSYVAGRFGDKAVGAMLRAGAEGGVDTAIQKVTGISTKELTKAWHRALYDAYNPVLAATNEATLTGSRVFPKGNPPGDLVVGPALSPDGTKVVFFSERRIFSINLFLADVQSGEILAQLTEKAIDPHMDAIQFVSSAGSWKPDGSEFIYVAQTEGKPTLRSYSIGKEGNAWEYRIDDLGEIQNPTWSPDGKKVAFSGMKGGLVDLYVLDVESKELTQLSDDAYADLLPNWSPDGTRIAFSTDRYTSNLGTLSFGNFRLAAVDVNTRTISPIAAPADGDAINPQWASGGKQLYYISTASGIPNVYRTAVETAEITQLTNVRTGVAGISRLSPALSVAGKANRAAYTVFDEGNYRLFQSQSFIGNPPAEVSRSIPQSRDSVVNLSVAHRPWGQVATYLHRPRVGLTSGGFRSQDYDPELSLDYVAPPSIGGGASSYGAFVSAGTALYWSDLLSEHNLMTSFQTSSTFDGNFLNNLSAMAAYQNRRFRWNWGLYGGQFPTFGGGFAEGLAEVDGEAALVQRDIRIWQISREGGGMASYPFNRATRVEFSSGYLNLSYDGDIRTRAYSLNDGSELIDRTEDIPTPDALHLGTSSAAFVYDTSVFGGTSPVYGQRYRAEFGVAAGGITYTTGLFDFRKYFRLARPVSFAVRAMHYGRYGGGAEDPRQQFMYLGFPTMVRGYAPNSFSFAECEGTASGEARCPVYNQLFGSKIGVANFELRTQLFGPLGVFKDVTFLPVEIAPFYDAGVAWTSYATPSFVGGSRSPVSSTGVSMRVNIFGFLVGQLSMVRPLDRPRKGWHFEFGIAPGY